MMRDTLHHLSPSIQVVGVLVILLLIAGVGAYLGEQGSGVGFIEIMMLGMAILGLVGLAMGDRGIRFAYLGWIFLFVLGYRTLRLEITYLEDAQNIIIKEYGLIIHPLLLVIVFVFVLMLLQLLLSEKRSTYKWTIPRIVWIFGLFWIWGALIGWANGYLPQLIIEQILNFVVVIPIFAVTGYILQNQSTWRQVITMFFIAATYIAFFGSLEYVFPASQQIFSGYFNVASSTTLDVSGFARAPFSFWGQPIAVFICVLALPFVIPLMGWYKSLSTRAIIVGAFGINLFAIYIAGWRSMWATILIVSCIIAILSRDWKVMLLILVMVVAAYAILPPEAKSRIEVFTYSISGNLNASEDSSAVKRFSRIEDAINLIAEAPLGRGWTSSGYVHSDVLQLAVETGVPSSIIFVLWYLLTLWKILRRYLRSPNALTLALLASFLVVAVQFSVQGIYFFAQLIIPVWFVWALVECGIRGLHTDQEGESP